MTENELQKDIQALIDSGATAEDIETYRSIMDALDKLGEELDEEEK